MYSGGDGQRAQSLVVSAAPPPPQAGVRVGCAVAWVEAEPNARLLQPLSLRSIQGKQQEPVGMKKGVQVGLKHEELVARIYEVYVCKQRAPALLGGMADVLLAVTQKDGLPTATTGIQRGALLWITGRGRRLL